MNKSKIFHEGGYELADRLWVLDYGEYLFEEWMIVG